MRRADFQGGELLIAFVKLTLLFELVPLFDLHAGDCVLLLENSLRSRAAGDFEFQFFSLDVEFVVAEANQYLASFDLLAIFDKNLINEASTFGSHHAEWFELHNRGNGSVARPGNEPGSGDDRGNHCGSDDQTSGATAKRCVPLKLSASDLHYGDEQPASQCDDGQHNAGSVEHHGRCDGQ